jgi:hypothetical protein
VNNEGKQFRNDGNIVYDYFCYDKNIISPADGTVVELNDGIDDNIIGDINLLHNWGNSIVIKHTEYLYSQLSHIKKGSFKVKKGDFVRKGDVLARCGNSGRSPYPHLHFQLQATPYIGSKTIDYPIDHYVKTVDKDFELHSYEKPLLNETVSNVKSFDIIKNAFNMIPGLKMTYTINGAEENWEVKTDYYNNTYIYCDQTNSYAYIYNDGSVFYFKSFVGDKKSALFYFYQALYQVPLGFYQSLNVNDIFPPDITNDKVRKLVNDFVAPFYKMLKIKYNLLMIEVDNELMPDKVRFSSSVKEYFMTKTIKETKFEITVTAKGVTEIYSKDIKIELLKKS